MKILSKIAVSRAKEIAQKRNANAVIISVKVRDEEQQMAVSEEAWENRVCDTQAEKIATVDSTGAIL